MTAKPETTFTQRILRHLPPSTKLWREKMANPWRGGTADMWFSGPNADLWVEWKYLVLPKRANTVVRVDKLLTALQLDWIESRQKEGRSVWVILGCPQGGVILSEGHVGSWTVAQLVPLLLPSKVIAEKIVHHTGVLR